MWEDAMNKMFNPFNLFREWKMTCLSLCYLMSFFCQRTHFNPVIEERSWCASILICRSVPVPVETVLPLCSLFHFFPMTDLITFSSFQPERVPLLRKKVPLDMHHIRLPLLCKLKIDLYGILLKWWKMLQRLPLPFVYLPNPTESVWPERKFLCVLFLDNFFNKMRLPRIRTTRPHSFIILIPRSHSFIFKLLERSAI